MEFLTKFLNHPQGCLAFRIESGGKTVVYASDNEPGDAAGDKNVREIAGGADLMVYDAQYTPEQLQNDRKGWGHSSWQEGIKVCREADTKQLVLFHHDPDRSDNAVDELLSLAIEEFPSTHAACEGMEITL